MFGLVLGIRFKLVFVCVESGMKMVTKKQRDEVKLKIFHETVKRFKMLQEEKLFKKAKSFKEFLQFVTVMKAKEILGDFGYAGSDTLKYYAFIRACVRDFVKYVLTWGRYTSMKQIQKAIDMIFDYYEFWWLERWNMDKKVTAEIERMMVEVFLDVRKYMHDWEYILEQKEKEEAVNRYK